MTMRPSLISQCRPPAIIFAEDIHSKSTLVHIQKFHPFSHGTLQIGSLSFSFLSLSIKTKLYCKRVIRIFLLRHKYQYFHSNMVFYCFLNDKIEKISKKSTKPTYISVNFYVIAPGTKFSIQQQAFPLPIFMNTRKVNSRREQVTFLKI